jgi:uncharacterized delta-60 repeat protein
LGEREGNRGRWGGGGSARALVTLVVCSAVLLAVASTACADPGDADPSFSRDGRVLTDIRGDDTATAVAVQPDGKIVAAGFSSPPGGTRRFALVRYEADGALDPSFGDGGIVTTRLGADSAAQAVAIEPDGKIVVAGTASRPETGWDFALARYDSDGALDTSLSGDGRVLTDFGGGADGAHALALDSDGQLVAAGESEGDFAVARYEPDGDLDPSFGGDGRATTDFSGFADGAYAIALQPDGKAVLAGYATDPPGNDLDRFAALARYQPDGDLDSSFGGGGRVITSAPYSVAYALASLGDGRLIIAGDGGLSRLNSDGSVDASFEGRNSTRRQVGSMRALAVQADGALITAGSAGDFQVNRWSADGRRDRTFGAVPSAHSRFSAVGAITDFGLFRDDTARAAAIQQDGKIVVAGRSGPGYEEPADFAVARYRVDGGSADADADGITDSRDLCPRRYTSHEPDGCPHYERSVSIRYSNRDEAFEGHVFSPQPRCKRYTRVFIFKRRREGDGRLARHGYGPGYEVPANPGPGRYYAEVRDTYPYPDRLGICEPARSSLLRVER